MNFSHYIVVFMPSFLAWECGLRLGIMGYDNLAQRKTNQTELMAQSQICPLFRSARLDVSSCTQFTLAKVPP